MDLEGFAIGQPTNHIPLTIILGFFQKLVQFLGEADTSFC
jgi:hypothetical protein